MIPVPELLDQLALAGEKGVTRCDEVAWQRDLNLCLTWGYPVVVSGKRVRLVRDPDTLVPAWIVQETPPVSFGTLRVKGFLEVGSTNEEARSHAESGEAGGFLLYAESQTAGRGRVGRQWESPPRAGLYFTLLVRPSQPRKVWPLLTHVASAALAQTLKEIPYRESSASSPVIELKWPNDVLLCGRKTAGILLEVAGGSGKSAAALIGVGLNVARGALRAELQDKATSVGEFSDRAHRRELLVRFLRLFDIGYGLFESGNHSQILDQWKNHSSMWNGAAVEVQDGDQVRRGITCGLSDLGALKIRVPEGRVEILLAGDIRVLVR